MEDGPVDVRELIVGRLGALDAATVMDLGCGDGTTLSHVRDAAPRARLVGVDIDPVAIATARRTLGESAQLGVADLRDPLDVADGTVDVVVCHNVLECLADPVALMDDVARVLVPGGIAVWSHVDFDALIVAGAEPPLTRSVVHAYADHTQGWMLHSDGHMGRKLPGLAEVSALEVVDVMVHSPSWSGLTGAARGRIDEIAAVLDHGAGGLGSDAVRHWRGELERADAESRFFFAEPIVIVTTRAPG